MGYTNKGTKREDSDVLGLFWLWVPNRPSGNRGGPECEEGGVTAKVYLKVVEEYLPTILEHDSIFMQDNTPIHKVHKVRDWFIDNGIDVMD